MSSGALIGILIAIVVAAVIAVVAAQEVRRARLRRQFGPEYARLASELGGNRKAEAALLALQRKAARLSIRPLSPDQRARYAADWAGLQERFVDSPADAVTGARRLIARVMRERGYPDADARDTIVHLSVHHPHALDDFRRAEAVGGKPAAASTEDLRAAVLSYRTLFQDLTGDGARREIRAAARNAAGTITRAVPVITAAIRPRTSPREEASRR